MFSVFFPLAPPTVNKHAFIGSSDSVYATSSSGLNLIWTPHVTQIRLFFTTANLILLKYFQMWFKYRSDFFELRFISEFNATSKSLLVVISQVETVRSLWRPFTTNPVAAGVSGGTRFLTSYIWARGIINRLQISRKIKRYPFNTWQ